MTTTTLVLAPRPDDGFADAAAALIAAKTSKNTRDAYSRELTRWIDHCGLRGVRPEAPTLADAVAFREALRAQIQPVSVCRALAALSHIYGVLFARGGVRGNPFHPKVLDWPVVENVGKTAAVDAEVAEAMIASAQADGDLRGAAILRLLYDRGLRRASVGTIARHSLRVIQGRTVVSVEVKGGRQLDVELPEATAAAVRAWAAAAPESAFLFPGRGDQPMNLTMINKIVTARAKRVGAEGVSPHCFRAAFITAAYDLGLPEREIQASAHHKSSATTQRYDRGARGEGVAEAVARARRGE